MPFRRWNNQVIIRCEYLKGVGIFDLRGKGVHPLILGSTDLISEIPIANSQKRDDVISRYFQA